MGNERSYTVEAVNTQVAVVRLAKAVDRLTDAVERLAETQQLASLQGLDPENAKERYERAVQSLVEVKRDLGSVVAVLLDQER